MRNFPTCVAFEEYAVSRLQLHDGKIRDNKDDAINDLIQMYIDNFKNNKAIPQRIRDNFTREKAEKEAVADFIARTLFKGNTAQLRVALKTDTAALQAIETDLKLFEKLAKDDRNLLQKVIDAIKDFIASIKGIPQFRQLEEDLNYIEQRLSRVYNSRDIKNTATDSGVVSYSFDGNINSTESRKVVDIIKTNIAKISDKNLFDEKSVDIRNYNKKSDYVLEVFNNQGNVASNKTIGNVELVKSGAKSTMLHGYGRAKIAAIPAIKTVIEKGDIVSYEPQYTSYYDRYIIAARGKIDGKPAIIGVVVNSYNDNGVNKFYLHEAEIIEAGSSSMTGSPNGEDTVNNPASKQIISDEVENVKQKQLEIINKTNPAYSDSFTWIRKVEDIHTLEETLSLSDLKDYDEFDPDLTKQDILDAIERGTITVYSSHPIENGAFVTPSRMEAETYAGNGTVYEKEVNIQDVAWIDPTQGQYAKADANTPTSKYDFSFSSDDLDAEYSKLMAKKPIKVSSAVKAKINNQRMNRYSTLTEGDIPFIDFFRIAEYNMVDVAYRYTVRNDGKGHFEVIRKQQIKKNSVPKELNKLIQEERESARTNPRTNKSRNGRYDNSFSNNGIGRSEPIQRVDRVDKATKETDEGRDFTENLSNDGNISFSSDGLTATHRDLLDRYEQGEITKEEYLTEMDSLYGQAVEQYGAITKGEYNETDMPVPQAVAEDKPTERFARTFVGAAKLTPEMANEFEKDAIN